MTLPLERTLTRRLQLCSECAVAAAEPAHVNRESYPSQWRLVLIDVVKSACHHLCQIGIRCLCVSTSKPPLRSLFRIRLRAWHSTFQELDLAVVVGLVFGDVKPFGVVVR